MIKFNSILTVITLVLSLLPVVVPTVSAWRNVDSEYSFDTSSTYVMSDASTTIQIGEEGNIWNYILTNFNFGGSSTQLAEPAHQINRALHILAGSPSSGSGNATVCSVAVYLYYLSVLWIAWLVLSVISFPIRLFTRGVSR